MGLKHGRRGAIALLELGVLGHVAGHHTATHPPIQRGLLHVLGRILDAVGHLVVGRVERVRIEGFLHDGGNALLIGDHLALLELGLQGGVAASSA